MSRVSENTTVTLPQLLDDVTLHEDDLSEEAKNRFKYHTQILRAFETYRRTFLLNVDLTPVGRHLLFSSLDRLHKSCKQVLNYVAENNAILNGSLPVIGPVVICGLPRTGTTLLYNLLACDPDCRAPLFTDMMGEPVPPISRSDLVAQERRTIAASLAEQQQAQLGDPTTQMSASHPQFSIDDDVYILIQAGFFARYALFNFDDRTDPNDCLRDELNKDFAYDYHETFLRMLNSVDTPRSHWLLKTPWHMMYMDTLLEHYPKALLIMTHRRLDEVFPSFCRFLSVVSFDYFSPTDSNSRDKIIKKIVQYPHKMTESLVKLRTRKKHPNDLSNKNIIDIRYDDLVKNPIETVRRIYNYFGLRWSNEFELSMSNWLRDNPQGKQGRNTYSLAEFGLTREDIEARHADYINLFLPASSSNEAGNN